MKRFLFFIFFIIVIFVWIDINPFQIIRILKKEEHLLTDRIRNAAISIGYILDRDKWTQFRIVPQNEGIKVATNANISRPFSINPERQYWYAIKYQVLDKNMKIMADRKYYHRTRFTRYNYTDNDLVQAQFYLDRMLMPLDTRIMHINLEEIGTKPYLIRFAFEWKEKEIKDIMLRAYIKERTSELKKGHLWHRFSEERKENLAKGNVFPYDLLRDQEKKNLIRAIYRPMGPQGIEGKGYVARELYVTKDITGGRTETIETLPGLYVDQYHHGIIPLPMEGGLIQLEFDCTLQGKSSALNLVTLKWFGPRPEDRTSTQIQWQGDKKIFQSVFQGGMIEIRSSKPLAVKALLSEETQQMDITPEPNHVRAYNMDLNRSITYDIHHLKHEPTPFRADFRYIQNFDQTQIHLPITIHYELIDEREKVIKKGSFPLSQPLSYYDQASKQASGSMVSEPLSQYFRLMNSIRKVRFFSDTPVLVSAYNRPLGLVKQTRVPEDYFKFHLKEESRHVTWFALQPGQAKHLALENRLVLLKLQYRPPEEKKALLSGRFEWESYYPEKSWQGRYIFTPRETDFFRKEQLRSIFRQIPVGKDTILTFQQSVKGLNQVQPSLIFLRQKAEHRLFQILINGKPYIHKKVRGNRGEISLPVLSSGVYTVKLLSPPDTKAFINYTGSALQSFLRRFAIKLDHQGLNFKYEKKAFEEEVLSARYFKPINDRNPSIIRVQIDSRQSASMHPFSDNTLVNRRFIIKSGKTIPPVVVLNTKDEYVDQGRLFFIPLGGDTRPGYYAIRFSLEQGTSGYLIFSKITLGVSEKRQFYKENGLTNADYY